MVSALSEPDASLRSGNRRKRHWPRKTGDVHPKRRAIRTNDPLTGLDRRTCDIARKLLQVLDNTTDVLVRAAVIQAAELSVLTEEARTAALAAPSDKTLINNVVRLQRLADTAYSRLGMFDPRKNRSHHARQNTLGGYLNEAPE
jgi:hypothetical protein